MKTADIKSVCNPAAAPIELARAPFSHCFKISEGVWREALARAELDQIAGIRHVDLGGDASWRLHIAEIADKVACHVHTAGVEIYEILAGEGNLFSGPVDKIGGEYCSRRCDELSVKSGDVFNVPEGYAHQLVRKSAEPLVIIFACPDSHLTSDRIILPDLFTELSI
ncbi:MAG: hypothetical protein EOM80_17655 [Erysipelotrichia bacterium]|nr:hypothetical protein [Erysipelotrichia bacterium]